MYRHSDIRCGACMSRERRRGRRASDAVSASSVAERYDSYSPETESTSRTGLSSVVLPTHIRHINPSVSQSNEHINDGLLSQVLEQLDTTTISSASHTVEFLLLRSKILNQLLHFCLCSSSLTSSQGHRSQDQGHNWPASRPRSRPWGLHPCSALESCIKTTFVTIPIQFPWLLYPSLPHS